MRNESTARDLNTGEADLQALKKSDDFLFELFTEELPPKKLLKLAQDLLHLVQTNVLKAGLQFKAATYFASPRRLAIYIKNLSAAQDVKIIERRGPAIAAAFDANNNPTSACIGFAKSLGVTPADLITITTPQGAWVGLKQELPGETVFELLPPIINAALQQLPIAKRMRWSNGDIQFVRPVHHVMMLYGAEIIPATILGLSTDRITRGHRFLASDPIHIPHPQEYAALLDEQGYVVANFALRREKILNGVQAMVAALNIGAEPIIDEDLLNEVTGLVEYPVAVCGQFDESYLTLPREALIACMQDHQRYFAVRNASDQLQPYFVTVSNIPSKNPAQLIKGNERVLRARLSDAAFFYHQDQEQAFAERLQQLKTMQFQAKLGSMFDKAVRLEKLTAALAELLSLPTTLAARAGLLAKCDLTTHMVGEFPELQGVMGGYYSHAEDAQVSAAIAEQYRPRFAGDALPSTALGQILALADKLDNMSAAFSISQFPTGDKDPYGLRRAAIGLLRIIIENHLDLDLSAILALSLSQFNVVENKTADKALFRFIMDRLRAWYLDQGVSPQMINAVQAVNCTHLVDFDARVNALQIFMQLPAAVNLCSANKRVANLLSKQTDAIDTAPLDLSHYQSADEHALAQAVIQQTASVNAFVAKQQYAEALLALTDLNAPLDAFFQTVMVMTDDLTIRERRLKLLAQIRALFLKIADISECVPG